MLPSAGRRPAIHQGPPHRDRLRRRRGAPAGRGHRHDPWEPRGATTRDAGAPPRTARGVGQPLGERLHERFLARPRGEERLVAVAGDPGQLGPARDARRTVPRCVSSPPPGGRARRRRRSRRGNRPARRGAGFGIRGTGGRHARNAYRAAPTRSSGEMTVSDAAIWAGGGQLATVQNSTVRRAGRSPGPAAAAVGPDRLEMHCARPHPRRDVPAP